MSVQSVYFYIAHDIESKACSYYGPRERDPETKKAQKKTTDAPGFSLIWSVPFVMSVIKQGALARRATDASRVTDESHWQRKKKYIHMKVFDLLHQAHAIGLLIKTISALPVRLSFLFLFFVPLSKLCMSLFWPAFCALFDMRPVAET